VHKRSAAPFRTALNPAIFSISGSPPFVCRYLVKSAFERLPECLESLSSRDATIIGIKETSPVIVIDPCRKNRLVLGRTRRILPPSFRRSSRVVDPLQMRNLSSIWTEGSRPRRRALPTPHCWPGPVSGSVIIVRAAREWMFWVFVNTPSDTFECYSSDLPYIFLSDTLPFLALLYSPLSLSFLPRALVPRTGILFLSLNSTVSRRVAKDSKWSFIVRGWNELVVSDWVNISPFSLSPFFYL